MKEYPKIQTIFKRDPENKNKTLLLGQYSIPEFEYLKDCWWEFTEKIDGTNIRIGWDGKNILFSGRTDTSQIPSVLVNKLKSIFTIDKMLEVFGNKGGLVLYGEGYGKGIRSGEKYIKDDCNFILFDILCEDSDIWFERYKVCEYAWSLNIDHVPIRKGGNLDMAIELARDGFTSSISNCQAEGLVLRPGFELKTRLGDRIITKIKTMDFSKINK